MINGNFAIGAQLKPSTDALALEKAEDNPYANFLAVKKGNEDDPRVKKLAKLLNSPEVKKFIEDKYKDGSVIPPSAPPRADRRPAHDVRTGFRAVRRRAPDAHLRATGARARGTSPVGCCMLVHSKTVNPARTSEQHGQRRWSSGMTSTFPDISISTDRWCFARSKRPTCPRSRR